MKTSHLINLFSDHGALIGNLRRIQPGKQFDHRREFPEYHTVFCKPVDKYSQESNQRRLRHKSRGIQHSIDKRQDKKAAGQHGAENRKTIKGYIAHHSQFQPFCNQTPVCVTAKQHPGYQSGQAVRCEQWQKAGKIRGTENGFPPERQ